MKRVKIGLEENNVFPSYTMKYGKATAHFEYSSFGVGDMIEFVKALNAEDVKVNIREADERNNVINALQEAGIIQGGK